MVKWGSTIKPILSAISTFFTYPINNNFIWDSVNLLVGTMFGGNSNVVLQISDEINKILETIDDFHQELGSQVEMKGDESGDYQYETMEKQLSRYINGAQKQLEGLQKYLERQKGKGL